MKTILMSMAMLLTSIAVFSQVSTVTINATGNRNKQLLVDNQSYTLDNTSATDVKEIVINNVTPGQHTLTLVRNNRYNQSSKTTFTVREGYDLTITITSNGTLSTTEARAGRDGRDWNDRADRPMNATQFNRVYNATRAKSSSSARTTYLENEFAKIRRELTAQQARQLIQLVNSESSRLKLAKMVYPKVSDQQNFNLVVNLLNSSSNRNDLNAYIATVERNDDDSDENTGTAMTDARFRVIYNEIQTERTLADKTYYLNNFFNRDMNFYTSAQAKQFIELISGDEERFIVAKAAYRGITDRENFSVVYPLLRSYSNRTALQNYVNSYTSTTNPGTRAAMGSVEFERLYNSVYNSYGSTARYNAINSAFTTGGNYFTVAQAKRLIPLATGESNRLALAKISYKVLVDPTNYLEYNDFLSTTASRNEFRNYVMGYDNNGGGIGYGNAMTDAEYQVIYRSVSNSWSTASKVQLLTDAFNSRTNYFTVAQVRQLLTLVNNENDRLPLAKSAYDNIVDLNNYSQLYDLFSYASNRNELANWAANMQNGNNTTVKVAMSESAFNAIYNRVTLTFGFGAKYTELTNIFNTETNYFTVAQARKLVALVSSEENRLELAKAAYNNVTDPSNFTQMYDLLSSQQSRNELAAYVGSNAVNN